jgi:hypothetical protein
VVRAALLRGGQVRNPTEKGAGGAHMEVIGAFERCARPVAPGEGGSRSGQRKSPGGARCAEKRLIEEYVVDEVHLDGPDTLHPSDHFRNGQRK